MAHELLSKSRKLSKGRGGPNKRGGGEKLKKKKSERGGRLLGT